MSVRIVEFLLSGFTDNSGQPLAAGQVYTYSAGTSTPKATYTDSAGTIPAANPVVLDAYGRAQIYASGNYKFTIETEDNEVIATYDNITLGDNVSFSGSEVTNIHDATARTSAISFGQVQDGIPPSVATVGGTGDAITLTPAVAITAYGTLSEFSFKVAASNTTAVTVTISSVGARNIKKVVGGIKYALEAGDLTINQYARIKYDGVDFILITHVQVEKMNFVTASGTNTIVITGPTTAVMRAGDIFAFLAAGTNTGAVTINPNGIGAQNLYHSLTNLDLVGGELVSGKLVIVEFDGTAFRLLSPYSSIIDRVTASTTVSNTVTETTIYSKSIPANTIPPFRSLRLKLFGDFQNNTGAARGINFRVKFGGTTIALFSYQSITFNDIATGVSRATWLIEQIIDAVLSSSQYTYGQCLLPQVTSDAGGAAGFGAGYHQVSGHTGVSVNSAIANTLSVTAELSTASASLTVRSLSGTLEVV